MARRLDLTLGRRPSSERKGAGVTASSASGPLLKKVLRLRPERRPEVEAGLPGGRMVVVKPRGMGVPDLTGSS